MTFGEKLSKLRKENNYTQEKLAEILGVSRQSVSKWESDVAYPETDKLKRIGNLFDCSMDYLLNDEVTEKRSNDPTGSDVFCIRINKQFKEKKSEKVVFGMPLYHIGKDARGFIAVGLRARGVISIGLLSNGIISFGLLSLGIISIGLLSLGLISFGCFAIGALALGAVTLGILALGAISFGIVSFGAMSIGLFSSGALAIGKYFAIGDHASALIAIGKTKASGEIYQFVGQPKDANVNLIKSWLDSNVPQWLSWAKEIIYLFFN